MYVTANHPGVHRDKHRRHQTYGKNSRYQNVLLILPNSRLTVVDSELHRIRAHLLHYASLLDDFKKSVKFVLTTPNPAMDSRNVPENGTAEMLTKEESAELLKKECDNLISEIGAFTRPSVTEPHVNWHYW